MPYGKHRGTYVDELPQSYLEWLAMNACDTLPPGLLRAVEQALGGDGTLNGDDVNHRAVTNRPSPRQEAQDYLQHRMSAGRWVPLFLDDLGELLSLREAVVLGIIVNLLKLRADANGYVQLAPAYLLHGPLGLSEEKQDRVLSSLVEKGIIAVRGLGDQRLVRVRFRSLTQLTRFPRRERECQR
jgi:hypothetical protein